MVGDPPPEAAGGRGEDPGADHAQAVEILDLEQPAAVGLLDHAVGVVGEPRQYGDLVPAFPEQPRRLEDPGLRRPDLRVEVVRDEKEMHAVREA